MCHIDPLQAGGFLHTLTLIVSLSLSLCTTHTRVSRSSSTVQGVCQKSVFIYYILGTSMIFFILISYAKLSKLGKRNSINMFGGCLPLPSLPGQCQWEVSLPGWSLARHNNNNMTNMTSDAPVSSGLALIGPQRVVKVLIGRSCHSCYCCCCIIYNLHSISNKLKQFLNLDITV